MTETQREKIRASFAHRITSVSTRHSCPQCKGQNLTLVGCSLATNLIRRCSDCGYWDNGKYFTDFLDYYELNTPATMSAVGDPPVDSELVSATIDKTKYVYLFENDCRLTVEGNVVELTRLGHGL